MLSVADIYVEYGRTPALTGPSLSVDAGEIVSIIGRNGVGKTTLLKAIIGLLRVTSGAIRLDGEDLSRVPAHERARRGLGYVPQGRMIFAGLTVEEHLLIGADLNRANGRALLEEVLDDFPRLRERYRQLGDTLSGGEQQMLAVARALMARPRLLLLDEPSMGLAPVLVEVIFNTISRIRTQGTTVLLVEQNALAALDIADRAYVLESGILKLSGPAATLASDPEIASAYLGGA